MSFRWEDIDDRLVVLKLMNLAEEMRHQIRADKWRIQSESHGDLNRKSLVLKMEQDRADEWARRAYEIYCEVWHTQGHAKSADFVRAVGARVVMRLLQARTEKVAREFTRFARGRFPFALRDAKLNGFRLNMLRLESRWRRRLEIEAKECEHAERRERLASTRVSQSAIPPTETPQEITLSEKRSPQKKPSLGPKKQDLSQYLDSAKLTQRQHECMSLHFEYGLKLTEIANRLGIDRKTVEEHLALAKAKLEKQTARGRHEKNFAKKKPGGLDM